MCYCYFCTSMSPPVIYTSIHTLSLRDALPIFLPGALIGSVEDQGVLVDTQLAHLVHDASDAGVELHNAVGVLGLRQRLVLELGRRHVRLMHLHEIYVDIEGSIQIGRAHV